MTIDPPTPKNLKVGTTHRILPRFDAMLKTVNAKSVDALIEQTVPSAIRLKIH